MCLIALAYDAHPDQRLVLIANRDEFHARPTAALHFWEEHPHIAAGRDLQAMGTWLGITRDGRFAALTNVRESEHTPVGSSSRGNIVTGFLTSKLQPQQWLDAASASFPNYQGFNLLFGSLSQGIYFTGNRGGAPGPVTTGVHGLSNGTLNDDWPKVRGLSNDLRDCLSRAVPADNATLLALLKDTRQPEDQQLPDTGVSLAWERRLAPRFITSPEYGTRSSSIIVIDQNGAISFSEYSFGADGETQGCAALHWQL